MPKENVQQILERIQEASIKSAYNEQITLVAVSKNRSVAALEEMLEFGIADFGENRVQELLEKSSVLDGRASWHFIGTLQKNKVRTIVGKCVLIHSVDTISLAEEIDKRSRQAGLATDILLQANVSMEASKHGFKAGELQKALEKACQMPNLRVRGIMCIGPNTGDKNAIGAVFSDTRRIFDKLMKIATKYDNINFDIISMGMTNDFEQAIANGANMLRIGRALFE
ncbi:MAG: YggS family pyridoxal phosphate-dependent enzyme [Eubacteriaceae bacterium]|nr:YggS family pyridoxal phosphate-dependent enzyme [Eubacteriaceae bacterium]